MPGTPGRSTAGPGICPGPRTVLTSLQTRRPLWGRESVDPCSGPNSWSQGAFFCMGKRDKRPLWAPRPICGRFWPESGWCGPGGGGSGCRIYSSTPDLAVAPRGQLVGRRTTGRATPRAPGRVLEAYEGAGGPTTVLGGPNTGRMSSSSPGPPVPPRTAGRGRVNWSGQHRGRPAAGVIPPILARL